MEVISIVRSALANNRTFALIVAAPLALLAICAITYIWSTIRYYYTLHHNNNTRSVDVRSPIIPYAIPWLGSSLSFLAPHPGRFYRSVLSWHPPKNGYFGVMLAGEVNHMVYSSRAVQALFKLKATVAHRDHLNQMIVHLALGVSMDDCNKMQPHGIAGKRELDEELNQALLLRQSAVNELTTTFVCFLKPELAKWSRQAEAVPDAEKGNEGVVVDLYAWLKSRMFGPSVTSFLGDRMMRDAYPEFASDFWKFDDGMLNMLFGIPKFIKPEPYVVRDRIVAMIEEWTKRGDVLAAADPAHNTDREWEPIFGSRMSRARQARFSAEGLTTKARAALDLGFLFGINSNAIPATGWMLFHILDPAKPDLLPRVLKELRRAVIPSPSSSESATPVEQFNLDINTLIAQPLLMSIYQEVLRLYVDTLVARLVEADVRLPLDATTPDGKPRMLLVRKGETIICPNIVSHNDETFFNSPSPSHVFDPHRFLAPADVEKSGKGYGDEYKFTTAAAQHKLWPYGGGGTICPGRVFAKQEILATVATVLLSFEIEAVEPESYIIPGFSNVYSGSGAIAPGGDVRVRIRPRRS